MEKSQKKRVVLIKFMFLLGLVFWGSSAGADQRASEMTALIETWAFDVLVGKKKIGRHLFEVSTGPRQTRVSSSAQFDYKVLNIPIFKYTHSTQEIYNDELCLQRISSSTITQSKLMGSDSQEVEGEIGGAGFKVTGSNNEFIESSCVMSFAYWTPKLLNQKVLLNGQDGNFLAVSITQKRETDSQKTFLLKGDDIEIELIYSGEGRWLSLESKLRMGRTLRYRLSEYQSDG